VPAQGYWEDFVREVVSRNKDIIQHWEFFNEPNAGCSATNAGFFEGDVTQYVDFVLVPGADAVHDECPTCKVVAPGVHNLGAKVVGVGQCANQSGLDWLDYVLAKARSHIDIIAYHNYRAADNGFVSEMEAIRQKMLDYFVPLWDGQSGVPVWLTETGYSNGAPWGSPTGTEQQRYYIHRVLQEMVSRTWWSTTIFFAAFDTFQFANKEGTATSDVDWVLVDGGWAPTPAISTHNRTYAPKPAFFWLQQAVHQEPYFGGFGAPRLSSKLSW